MPIYSYWRYFFEFEHFIWVWSLTLKLPSDPDCFFWLNSFCLIITIINIIMAIYDSSVFVLSIVRIGWLNYYESSNTGCFTTFLEKALWNDDFPPLSTVPDLSLGHFLIYWYCSVPAFYWSFSYSSFINNWHKFKSEDVGIWSREFLHVFHLYPQETAACFLLWVLVVTAVGFILLRINNQKEQNKEEKKGT